MKLCIIGFIETDYETNWRLFKALDAVGIQYKIHPMPVSISAASFRKAYNFLKENRDNCDIIWISSFSHRIFFYLYLARFMVWFFQAPQIVYESIISIYGTRVFDRKLVRVLGPRALYYYVLDYVACRLSYRIIIDTNAHAYFFKKTLQIRPSKIRRVFAGANKEFFYTRETTEKKRREELIVGFHGKLIPGMMVTEYIMEAVKILRNESVKFMIYGKGSLFKTYEKIIKEENLTNIVLAGQIPYESVAETISKSDVLLGAFVTTPKALRVIPIKIFEGLAVARPIIIGDPKAARELLDDRIHCLYAKIADSVDLAEKIMLLKNNHDLRASITRNGYDLYSSVLSHEKIGRQFKEIFEELLIK